MPRSCDTWALFYIRYDRHISIFIIIRQVLSVQNSIPKISGHFTTFSRHVQVPFLLIFLAVLTVPPNPLGLLFKSL